jgi:Domain of unknown function (DUF4082)
MRLSPVFGAALATVTIGLSATMLGGPTQAQANTNDPGALTATISSPANGWSGPKPLIITGDATDDSAVIRVELQIYRTSDNSFWNGTTSQWSTTYPPYGQRPVATIVSGQNSKSVSWAYTLNAPENSGSYWITAVAFDDAGGYSVSTGRTLTIDAGQTTTTVASTTTTGPASPTTSPAIPPVSPPTSPPDTSVSVLPKGLLAAAILSPADGFSGPKPLVITGVAADDSRVTRVELQIYRAVDRSFWNGATSSWTTAYPPYGQRPTATIVSGRDTALANWSYSFAPADTAGSYSFTAVVFDDANNFAVSVTREYRIDTTASTTTPPTTAVVAPTTAAPATSTPPPTTAAPTTSAPTTSAPVIQTTKAPTTIAATTTSPTVAPTTIAPTTPPTTSAPATVALPTGVLAAGIASPTNGWTGPRPVLIEGSAAASSRVMRVEMQVFRNSDRTFLNGATSTWSTSYPPYGQRPVASITSGSGTRTANWNYSLNVTEPSGSYSVAAIVFDDIGGFAVSPGRYYSFTDSQVTTTTTPGSRLAEQLYANSTSPAESVPAGAAIVTAQRVNVTCAGSIRGISWFRTAAESGTATAVVWRNGQEVARTNSASPTAGWQSLDFVIPVSVAAGDQLIVGVHHPNGAHARTAGALASGGVRSPSGCLTIPPSNSSAKNGLLTLAASPVLPTSAAADAEYFIAPNFERSTTDISAPSTTSTTTTSTTIAVSTTRPTTPPTTTPPAPPTLSDPLNLNPSVAGMNGWGASGAAYDETMSRTPGSGSFRFSGQGSSIVSRIVSVTPGQPYTISAFVRSGTWPSGNVSLFPLEMNASGGFVRLLDTALTVGAPGQPNTWQEVATVIVPDASTRYISIGANRAEQQFNTSDIWLDDLTIAPGVQTRVPNTAKTAFSGSQTRVDALGNWEVLENGQWKPWFPLCIAANIGRSNYGILSQQGFNCDIWSGFEAFGAEKAKSVGMRSFFQLSQYTQTKGWAFGNTGDLAAKIRAVNNSPAADYVAGYWWDNEAPYSSFNDYERIMRTVQNEDRLNGVRRRPIVQLQNSSISRAFSNDGVDFSDVLAGYVPVAGGNSAGNYTGNRLINQMLDGQRQPSSLCQLGPAGRHFRTALFGCIAHGGRASSYWMDGTGVNYDGFSPLPVDQQEFWPALPQIRREIDAMMPIIRTPESASWRVNSTSGSRVWPLAYSVREVNGVAHMIIANLTPNAIASTFRIDASTYQAGEVRDYFTNELLATVSNGSFSLTVAGSDLNTGTRVLKLLPR